MEDLTENPDIFHPGNAVPGEHFRTEEIPSHVLLYGFLKIIKSSEDGKVNVNKTASVGVSYLEKQGFITILAGSIELKMVKCQLTELGKSFFAADELKEQ